MTDTFETHPVRTIHVWLDGDGWHRDEIVHRPPVHEAPAGRRGGVVRILVDEWDVP